jgi:hypothetical protein
MSECVQGACIERKDERIRDKIAGDKEELSHSAQPASAFECLVLKCGEMSCRLTCHSGRTAMF